jgi:hypothetical protein
MQFSHTPTLESIFHCQNELEDHLTFPSSIELCCSSPLWRRQHLTEQIMARPSPKWLKWAEWAEWASAPSSPAARTARTAPPLPSAYQARPSEG